MGLPLPELISAILLLKREIWMSARQHGVWKSAMDLRRAVDLNRELGRFFDSTVYYVHRLRHAGEARLLVRARHANGGPRGSSRSARFELAIRRL